MFKYFCNAVDEICEAFESQLKNCSSDPGEVNDGKSIGLGLPSTVEAGNCGTGVNEAQPKSPVVSGGKPLGGNEGNCTDLVDNEPLAIVLYSKKGQELQKPDDSRPAKRLKGTKDGNDMIGIIHKEVRKQAAQSASENRRNTVLKRKKSTSSSKGQKEESKPSSRYSRKNKVYSKSELTLGGKHKTIIVKTVLDEIKASGVTGKNIPGGADAAVAIGALEGLLETLSRTKESIGRATRLSIDCAKYGIASEVIDLIIRKLEGESSFRRKVDLFFLVDSITQCSHKKKGIAGASYIPAVQAALPRLLGATVPSGASDCENRHQCLKVLRLWVVRKIMPEAVLHQYIHYLEAPKDGRSSGLFLRSVDEPNREMEGVLVDENGRNAGAFAPSKKGHHILKDVDGEIEMEDVFMLPLDYPPPPPSLAPPPPPLPLLPPPLPPPPPKSSLPPPGFPPSRYFPPPGPSLAPSFTYFPPIAQEHCMPPCCNYGTQMIGNVANKTIPFQRGPYYYLPS